MNEQVFISHPAVMGIGLAKSLQNLREDLQNVYSKKPSLALIVTDFVKLVPGCKALNTSYMPPSGPPPTAAITLDLFLATANTIRHLFSFCFYDCLVLF